LARKLVERGNQEAALSFLELLASTRPLDEQVHRVLIEALAGLGRRWEAIERYERPRDALEEEYAAELEPETKVLYRRLLSGNKPMPASHRTICRSRPPASSDVNVCSPS
jgi:DNA-binding SARP family transcriptional activator